MSQKHFTKNNSSFTCINCGAEVPPHPSSSRDHCNQCLYGLHVDINPGDRANKCRGLLKPIGLEIANRKEKILYRCDKCAKEVKCIVAPDDEREELIRL